jgi:hypothetical protein
MTTTLKARQPVVLAIGPMETLADHALHVKAKVRIRLLAGVDARRSVPEQSLGGATGRGFGSPSKECSVLVLGRLGSQGMYRHQLVMAV